MTGEDYKYNVSGSPILLAGAENGIRFGFSLLFFSVKRIISSIGHCFSEQFSESLENICRQLFNLMISVVAVFFLDFCVGHIYFTAQTLEKYTRRHLGISTLLYLRKLRDNPLEPLCLLGDNSINILLRDTFDGNKSETDKMLLGVYSDFNNHQ